MEFLPLSRRRSSARNVPTGEERGETDVFAGYCSCHFCHICFSIFSRSKINSCYFCDFCEICYFFYTFLIVVFFKYFLLKLRKQFASKFLPTRSIIDISDAKGNLFVFVLAAPACSKRIKKSDEVGAGRESEIPLYSNPSNNYII